MTPENIVLNLTIAAPLERAVACLVDSLLITAGNLVAAFFLGAVTSVGPIIGFFPSSLRDEELVVRVGILFFYLFPVSFLSYYILLEGFWSGQTIGKRVFRLRVLTTEGTPPDLTGAAIRNILRIVDYFPGTCGVGFVTMLISPYFRRLGDYAAGTIVVREGFLPPPPPPPLRSLPFTKGTFLDPLALSNLARLSDKQILALRYFLLRAPYAPEPTRSRVARDLAAKVARLLWDGTERDLTDPFVFIQEVVAAYDQKSARG